MGAAVLRGRRGRALAALFILAVSMDTYAPLQGAAAMGRVSPSAGACVRPISSPWSGRIDEATGKGALQLRGGVIILGLQTTAPCSSRCFATCLTGLRRLPTRQATVRPPSSIAPDCACGGPPSGRKPRKEQLAAFPPLVCPVLIRPAGRSQARRPRSLWTPRKSSGSTQPSRCACEPPPPLRRAPPVPARGEHRDGVRAPGHIGR